jgi:hypothetical protein
MSLLSNNAHALQILFNEELYAIGDSKENNVAEEAIAFDYLGGNNRFFLLLVHSPNEKYLEKQHQELLLKILQAKAHEKNHTNKIGEVISLNPLMVAVNNSILEINILQRAGKNPLNAKDFLNGFKINVGDILS